MLSSKAKPGRPPLEPRIAVLEAQVRDLCGAVLELKDRIEQISHMPAIEADVPRKTYQPVFDRWTGNGSAK